MTPDDVLLDAPPCLVVNKPGGILIQSPPGIDSLVDQVRQFEQQRTGDPPDRIYVGVPHRLDRPVSGAIVLARTRRAAQRLSEQFAGRLVGKEYWALVEGQVEPERGVWQDHLRKLPGEAKAAIAEPNHPDARIAVLHYAVERRDDFGSWLRIRLETGRMHQIRIQAGSRGHPVLGDATYGSTVPFGPETNDWRARWIGLHARRLTFRHPRTRDKLVVEAPVPACWLTLRPAEYWVPKSDKLATN